MLQAEALGALPATTLMAHGASYEDAAKIVRKGVDLGGGVCFYLHSQAPFGTSCLDVWVQFALLVEISRHVFLFDSSC